MEYKGKKLSFSLTKRLAIVITFCMIILMVINAVVTNNLVYKLVAYDVDSMAMYNIKVVDKYITKLVSYSKAMSIAVSQGDLLSNEKDTVKMLEGMLESDTSIYSAYIALEPNEMVKDTPKGKSFYVYTQGNGSKGVDINYDYEDYKGADYYAVARDIDKTHVTEPYSWEMSNGDVTNLITISTPIKRDGKFMGVANMDIDLEYMSDIEYDDGDFDSTRLFTLSNDFSVLAHTKDAKLIGKSMKQVADYLGGEKKKTVEVDGTLLIIDTVLIDNTDLEWKVGFAIDKSECHYDVYVLMGILTSLMVVALLIIILTIYRSIDKRVKPVNDLVTLAERIKGCELSTEGGDIEVNDEITYTHKAFIEASNAIQGYINELKVVLGSISNGDFTSSLRSEFVGDFGELQVSMNKAMANQKATVNNIKVVEGNVSESIEEFYSLSNRLIQSSDEQVRYTEALMAQLEEVHSNLSRSAEDIEVSSGDATNNADTINKHLDDSKVHMSSLLETMDGIVKTVSDVKAISKTIEDISFQTNILALNARIEAASAGQYGKGFAVVAGEVGDLASKSTEASKHTADLIGRVLESVEEGSKLASKTSASLADVITNVEQLLAVVTTTSDVIIQQAQVLSTALEEVGSFTKSVNENKDIVEMFRGMTSTLKEQADVLRDEISKFKVE